MKIDIRSNKLYLDAKAALNAVNANSCIFKLKLVFIDEHVHKTATAQCT